MDQFFQEYYFEVPDTFDAEFNGLQKPPDHIRLRVTFINLEFHLQLQIKTKENVPTLC